MRVLIIEYYINVKEEEFILSNFHDKNYIQFNCRMIENYSLIKFVLASKK